VEILKGVINGRIKKGIKRNTLIRKVEDREVWM